MYGPLGPIPWSNCNTPDTPGICPDTPDMEFLVHVIFVLGAPQPLNISLSLSLTVHSLTLSLSHVTPSPSHSLAVTSLSLTSALPLPRALNPKSSTPN